MVAGTKVGYLGPGRTGDLQEPNSMEASLGEGRDRAEIAQGLDLLLVSAHSGVCLGQVLCAHSLLDSLGQQGGCYHGPT